MLYQFRNVIVVFLFAAVLLGACASAPPSTIIHTAHNPDPGHQGFRNVLVISVAGDFESRAQFEREMAASIGNNNLAAAAYYTVLGRRPQLERAAIHNAVRSRKFDAVIFTRLKGQEQQDLAPMRPVGPGFDLFAYDYEELNRDISISQAKAITFVTEVYSTATQHKVLAFESLSFDQATASDLLSEQVAMIAAELNKDQLLAR